MQYKINEFPQDRFRFRIFDNAKKLTWQQIRKQTGCYALINLAYFNMKTFSNDEIVMAAGRWLYDEKKIWHDYGFLVDAEGRLTVGTEQDAVYDFCRGEPTYYINGAATGAKAEPKNGATMMGVRDNGDVVLMLAPKDAPISSADGVTELLAAGCTSILRFDGSWSTQGSLGPGLDVQPSQTRIVRTYLLVYEREDDKGEEAGAVNDDPVIAGVTRQYMMSNPCYTNGKAIVPKGIMVHSTASPGTTARELRDRWDKGGAEVSVHAFIDDTVTIQALPWRAWAWHAGSAYKNGPSANSTHISFEVCEPKACRLLPVEWVAQKRGGASNDPWVIKRIQQELIERGYDPKGVDGSFGPGCEAAVKKFQADNKLSVDGSVGPATRQALAARTGSRLQYDPRETEAYVAAVWDRAVALCAQLCREFGLDPLEDIICHAEGYKLGVASNHADVNHWWPLHGRSMDDFRAAVKAAMEKEVSDPDTITCPSCGHKFKI